MGWLSKIPGIFRAINRYGPILWLGLRTLWSMRQAKKRQEWFREALIEEGNRRAKAEANADLACKLNQPFERRMSRIRALAATINKPGDRGAPQG